MAKSKYSVPKSAITERGLKQLIKKAAKNHSSLSDWAQSHGITPQSISAFMLKKQSAGLQLPEALGYRPQTIYLPLGEELISHMNPPRKPSSRPSKKVDHTREPIEKRYSRPVDDRKETKRRLKRRTA